MPYEIEVIEVIVDYQAKGDTGRSAYQAAVLQGFVGTETEWIAFLKHPALDAANLAIQAAEDAQIATELATTAANEASAQADRAESATTAASSATQSANDAAGLALSSRDYFNYLFGITQQETGAVIEHARINGYKSPSMPYVVKLDAYIRGLKLAGIWGKMDVVYSFKGDGDLNFKCINLVNPALSGTPHGGLISTVEAVRANRVDAYVNTNYKAGNVTNQAAGNASISYNATDLTKPIVAGNLGYPRTAIYAVNGLSIRFNAEQDIAPGLDLSGLGFKSVNRVGNNVVAYSESGSSTGSTSVPLQLPVDDLIVFMQDGFFGGVGLTDFLVGSALTQQEAESLRIVILNSL